MRVADHVGDLAGSIAANEPLHPVTLRRDGGRLVLVAGRRRLEGVRLLGWDADPARVLDVGQTQALLLEIDENFQREQAAPLLQEMLSDKNENVKKAAGRALQQVTQG